MHTSWLFWFWWAAAGLSGLIRGARRGGQGPKGAPRVALLGHARLPPCPLRVSLVNPCRGPFILSTLSYFFTGTTRLNPSLRCRRGSPKTLGINRFSIGKLLPHKGHEQPSPKPRTKLQFNVVNHPATPMLALNPMYMRPFL